MGRSITTFGKDHQPKNRTPRTGRPGWRRLILEALEQEGYSEKDFVKALVSKAFDKGDQHSINVLIELVKRLDPIAKAHWPHVEFDFDVNATPVQKIDSVMVKVAAGEIPPDVGAMLVEMIKTGVIVMESTELAERLANIERMLQEQEA